MSGAVFVIQARSWQLKMSEAVVEEKIGAPFNVASAMSAIYQRLQPFEEDRVKLSAHHNKSNLEIARHAASTMRTSILEDTPPLFFHESRKQQGNLLYGEVTYPVADSSYKRGRYIVPAYATIFAHGMIQVTSEHLCPCVVLMPRTNVFQTGSPVPLTLVVHNAPLAAMEADLFADTIPSKFECEMFGGEATAAEKLKSRRGVGSYLRERGASEVDAHFLGGEYHLKRSGIIPFLRLRQPRTNVEDERLRTLVSKLHAISVPFWNQRNDKNYGEWLAQRRVNGGFEFHTVFCTHDVSSADPDVSENLTMLEGSMAFLASIIINGALELPRYDLSFCVDDTDENCCADRALEEIMTNVALEETAFVLETEFDGVVRQNHRDWLPNLWKDLRTPVAMNDHATGVDNFSVVKFMLSTFCRQKLSSDASEHIQNSIRSAETPLEAIKVAAHELFDPDSAVLGIERSSKEGLVYAASLVTKDATYNLRPDDVVRFTLCPWVATLVLDSTICSAVLLSGETTERLTMSDEAKAQFVPESSSAAFAPSFDSQTLQAFKDTLVSEVIKTLKEKLDAGDLIKNKDESTDSNRCSSSANDNSLTEKMVQLKRRLVAFDQMESKRSTANKAPRQAPDGTQAKPPTTPPEAAAPPSSPVPAKHRGKR